MSFTKVAPAGIGTEPGNSILIGDSLLHSTGIDIGSNTGIGVTIRKHGDATFTGIITASAFFGDGSGLEGVSSSGIGTPLSDNDTSELNKVYYVNQELSIGSTVTVNHPDSAIASYTHYQDLVVKDNADFIVTDGDTFIPDVLGINTASLPNPVSGATGGRIRAGTITNAGANGAPNFPNGLTGTAGTFTGNLNVGGVLTYEDVTNVDSIGIVTARGGIRVGANGTKRETVHLDVGDSGANYLRFTNTTTGNGAADGFNVGINADENALLWNFENKNTIFATNNLERFRITSAGKVAIGTTLIGHDDADNLTIDGSGEGTGRTGITIRSATNTFGSIFFSDATSGNAQYDGVIAYQHDTQQMRFSTAETQRMFIDSTGKVTKPFQPFFKAQPSTAQNITSGSGTVVNYQAEIHDVGGIYNASASTFTAPIGGIYLITWNYFCIPTDKIARANLHKSTDGGGSFAMVHRGDRVGKQGDVYEATSNIAMVDLNANDQLRIQHEEGDLHVNTGYNYFQGYLLG